MITFPKNFLWGAATSAYQVEGGNINSDWWPWEEGCGKEKSGQACRHYELFKQDFDLAKNLNHNAHRLSIEWARIEPEEGKFSQEELKHYLEVILALKERNIEPLVTLHHFTNPIWFSKQGGWENKQSVEKFLRYCDFVVTALAEHVRYWVTINEPNVYLTHAYIIGVWPPQVKSYFKAKVVDDHLVLAHIKAYQHIHKIYQQKGIQLVSVGIAQNVQAFVPCTLSLKNRFAAYLRSKWYNFWFFDEINKHKAMDFIGVNYYSRQLVDVENWGMFHLAKDVCKKNHYPVKKNSLGWDIYPEGLYQVLIKMKKYGLAVIITENGICTADDELRWEYISAHLKSIHAAIEEGVNVAGYLYWSLMDNFEWDKGFGPRFGLIEIDYNTYKRTVRASALKLSEVCRTGVLS